MMPIKEILEKRLVEPMPPIMVIDETTIKETVDAGPVCECLERYEAIQNYNPFLPGCTNPYNRRKIPDSDTFDIFWKNLKLGTEDYIHEKPFALLKNEVPDSLLTKKEDGSDLMFLHVPTYSEKYYKQKCKQCSKGCTCGPCS